MMLKRYYVEGNGKCEIVKVCSACVEKYRVKGFAIDPADKKPVFGSCDFKYEGCECSE